MCLLVSQPKHSFSTDFLIDVYTKNQDGLGVMYAEDGKVHVYKCLPANAQDFVDFYVKHAAGRECIWHARMQTHGDVDMDNCHPYRVTDSIWLAHNGVLQTSNDSDQSKSDTWHFIKNVLSPALTHNPDLILDKEWVAFIGKLIGGSNKFALLRSDGETAIINKSSGVTFEDSWVSNTYAWTPSKHGYYDNRQPNHNAWFGQYYGTYGKSSSYLPAASSLNDTQPSYEVRKLRESDVKKYLQAAHNSYMRKGPDGLFQWVLDAPHKAAALLSVWYDDVEGIEDLPIDDPVEAADWIEEILNEGVTS